MFVSSINIISDSISEKHNILFIAIHSFFLKAQIFKYLDLTRAYSINKQTSLLLYCLLLLPGSVPAPCTDLALFSFNATSHQPHHICPHRISKKWPVNMPNLDSNSDLLYWSPSYDYSIFISLNLYFWALTCI